MAERKHNGVLIVGPLTDSDLKELAETLRRIEQRKPHETFLFSAYGDDDASLEEIKERMQEIFPAVEGIPVDIMTFKKKPKN